MCLSVYLGTIEPLPFSNTGSIGTLGFEIASWKPPTLEKIEYVYFLGQRLKSNKIGCSCLLWEQIDWQTDGFPVESDDTYRPDLECPFKALRDYCSAALDDSDTCFIVCDDSNGVLQSVKKEDYYQLFLTPNMIKRGNLIFGAQSPYPYRHFNVVRGELFK